MGSGVSVHRPRYQKKRRAGADEPEQYQLFEHEEYTYRAFATNIPGAHRRVGVVLQSAGWRGESDQEANNDAGLTAHPSAIWAMNCIHFQMAMLAYNLNCWLALFSREEKAKVETMKHTTLATSRLRFLFLAAKTWRHAGRVGVSYSDHYAEKGILERLMNRLRAIIEGPKGFAPVIASALRR